MKVTSYIVLIKAWLISDIQSFVLFNSEKSHELSSHSLSHGECLPHAQGQLSFVLSLYTFGKCLPTFMLPIATL